MMQTDLQTHRKGSSDSEAASWSLHNALSLSRRLVAQEKPAEALRVAEEGLAENVRPPKAQPRGMARLLNHAAWLWLNYKGASRPSENSEVNPETPTLVRRAPLLDRQAPLIKAASRLWESYGIDNTNPVTTQRLGDVWTRLSELQDDETRRTQMLERAARWYHATIALDKEPIPAYGKLLQVLIKLKRYDDERDVSNKLLELDPCNITNLLMCANISIRGGNYVEAQQRIDKVLRLSEGKHPTALHLQGVVALNQKQYTTALDAVNTSLASSESGTKQRTDAVFLKLKIISQAPQESVQPELSGLTALFEELLKDPKDIYSAPIKGLVTREYLTPEQERQFLEKLPATKAAKSQQSNSRIPLTQ